MIFGACYKRIEIARGLLRPGSISFSATRHSPNKKNDTIGVRPQLYHLYYELHEYNVIKNISIQTHVNIKINIGNHG